MNEVLWEQSGIVARVEISEDIELRLLSPEDVKHLYELQHRSADDLKPWLSWANTEQTIQATNDFVAHTDTAAKTGSEYHFGVHADNELVGVLGLAPIDYLNGTVTVGFWIGKNYWGKGIVSTSLRVLCEILLRKPNVHRIEARTALNNLRANRTLILAGFQHEGILRMAQLISGHSIDVNVYSRVMRNRHIVQHT